MSLECLINNVIKHGIFASFYDDYVIRGQKFIDKMLSSIKEIEENPSSHDAQNRGGAVSSSEFESGLQESAARPAYTFAEHAWALRQLRKRGIPPSNEIILETIQKRREQTHAGDDSSQGSPASLPSEHPPTQAAASLAEPYDKLGDAHLFEREIIRQEEFLSDAREWNQVLLNRVDTLTREILALQQRAEVAQELEALSGQSGNAEVSPGAIAETEPQIDLAGLLQDSQQRNQELEEKIEELKVEQVLNQSLERVIEEQKLSLEASVQRIDALTRQLDEAGYLKARAEQLHAELLEARSSLQAYRDREAEWRDGQAGQEELRLRAESELQRLRSGLEHEQLELGRVRADHEHVLHLLEEERNRAQLERTRSEAIISQLTRQLQEEKDARLAAESSHAAEVDKLTSELQFAHRTHEQAQKENSETIAALNREVEELRKSVSAARERGIEPVRLQEAESRLADAEARLLDSRSALEALEAESSARIARLQATIAELEPAQEELRRLRDEKSVLARELADRTASIDRLESTRTSLEERIASLLARQTGDAAAALRLEQKNVETSRLLEAAASRHREEIESLRKEVRQLDADADVLRKSEKQLLETLEERERSVADLRAKLASLESLIEEQPESDHAVELRRQLDEHREALHDARAQNHQLLERLEGTVKAFADRAHPSVRLQILRPVIAAAVFLSLVGGAAYAVWQWVPHWIPSVEEMQKSMETFEHLKQQNSALAADLNATLERLHGAKKEEVTLAEMRALRERLLTAEQALARYEQESTVNMARTTKLQSDLDLARQRLERISTELTTRDLKILELERLLGEAGAAVLQLPPTPRLTLAAPLIETALPGLPQLPELTVQTNEIGDVANDSLRTLQHQAEEAWKAKNFGLAEVLFQRLVEALPNNGLAFSNLAAVQLDLGKLTLARENILRAIALEPRDAFSHTTLGMILLRSGDSEGAQEALLQAIERDPKSPDAFHYLGVAFDQQGNRARAIEEIEKAIALSPQYAEAHFNLAVLYSQGTGGDLDKARAHYKKARELGADSSSELDALLR